MENKAYYLNESDAIINTIITVNRKEKRRTIDSKDIDCFKDRVSKLCHDKGFNIVFNEIDDCSKKMLNGYVLTTDNNIILLPWISIKDLIMQFRGHLSLDMCLILCDEELWNSYDERTPSELEKFRSKEDDIAAFYEADIKRRINDIETRRDEATKKLMKIRELNKR